MILRAWLALPLAAAFAVSASGQTFVGFLDGSQESPPVATTSGTGTGSAVFDPVTNMLSVELSFSGLTGTTTDSHIHCCFTDPPSRNIGVALGFTATFPMGVTSGDFMQTYDLLDSSVYTGSFLTNFGGGTAEGARNALLAGMTNSTAYFNIHTTHVGSGEIRGDIALIPEPSTALLALCGLVVVALVRRQRFR